jgi:hypothetical protein
VASDDNESIQEERSSDRPPAKTAEQPLPPSVERALAAARASAAGAGTKEASPGTKGARWLALIPITVAALTMLLMMPRAVPPEDVPLPQIDGVALEAQRHDDVRRAAAARATRLDGDILLVGTTFRALNVAQVSGASTEEVGVARTALESAFLLLGADGQRAVEGLRTLRALQLESFLVEVERFETTGKPSMELEELAGAFLDHMAAAGWLKDGKVILDQTALRSAYKLVWNAQIGADRLRGLALTLDEQRALYTFYLTHPHASEPQRLAYESMRRRSATREECQKNIALEQLDMEQWRIEKIKKLAELDPTYPTSYALGIAYYRAGRHEQSIESFRSWVLTHPDGAFALRARNHLKAALSAYGPT